MTFVFGISPHPAAEVLHQVDLHSLNAAIVAARVKLEETTAQFNRSPFTHDIKEQRAAPYHAFMYSHTHHHVIVSPIHLQTVM